MPAGVLTSESGYTLKPDHIVLDRYGDVFTFRITGPDGAAVQEFELRHERELHLILVGRDLGTFVHLHPSRAADGTWSAQLPALAPGAYRVFADFAATGGPELTLGADVEVPGDFQAAPLPGAAATDRVDGYEVAIAGRPVAGSHSEMALTVTSGGVAVADLEPYLGAFGHLVAIRAGDLAYLHVHPLDQGGERGGPTVRFGVAVPSPGDYRLFFEFAHAGRVHTAAFTIHVMAGDSADPSAA